MKKSTLENLCNYLNGDTTVDVATLREEVNAEYDRTTAKSRANAALYAAAAEVVFNCDEWDKPLSAKELFALVENDMPEDFTASKMQYALRETWADRVVKHDNGKAAFTYTKR